MAAVPSAPELTTPLTAVSSSPQPAVTARIDAEGMGCTTFSADRFGKRLHLVDMARPPDDAGGKPLVREGTGDGAAGVVAGSDHDAGRGGHGPSMALLVA